MNSVGQINFEYFLKNGEVAREKQENGVVQHTLQRFFGILRGHRYDQGRVAERLFTLATKESEGEGRANRLFLEEVLKKQVPSAIVSGATKVHEIVSEIFSQDTGPRQGAALKALGIDGEKVLGVLSKKIPMKSALGKRIEDIRDKMSILTTWRELSMDPSAIETDFDSVCFLVKERLIYSMAGLHNSSAIGRQTPPFTVRDGKVFMLQNGIRVPVHSLIDRFHFDPDGRQLVDAETKLPWNYFLPNGLVQVDSGGTKPLVPVTTLNRSEMDQLVQHALQLEGTSFTPDEPATCVFQLCTNPRPIEEVPNSPFLDGIHALAPVHVGFRIVDENGDVYSTGFATTPEERVYRTGISKILASINGLPSILDYEEFRPHEGRLVTSVPMTKRQCDDILYHLNAMRKRGVRFNFLKQNCSYMATEMAELAGVHIEHRLERARIFEYLLPHFSSFPPLNSFVKKVCALSERISRGTMLPSVGETVGAARSIIEWAIKPLDVVVTTICNLAMMSLGACSASPLKEGMYGNKPGEHMRSFYSVIQSAKDIFSNEPTTIYHSGPIIAWQQRQKSTHSTPYTVPIMNILPESSERGTSEKERPFLRFDTKM